MRNKKVWFVVLVGITAVLGLYLRLSWTMHSAKREWYPDEYYYYVSAADNAFEGRGLSPAYNDFPEYSLHGVFVPPPLQSLFILAVYHTFGKITNPVIPKLIQILFSTIAIILCAEIGKRLVSRFAGVLFAFLFAMYPEFVFWTEFLQTESNFLSMLVLLLFLLILWAKRGSNKMALWLSVLLGLLCLQRGTALLLGPCLAIVSLLCFRNKRGLMSAIIFALVPFCVISPWVIRNLAVHGEPIIISSNDGIVFHLSNHIHLNPLKDPYVFNNTIKAFTENKEYIYLVPEIEEKYRVYDENKANICRDYKVSNYVYSKAYNKVFLSYVAQHPVHFIKNLALKIYNQFWLIQNPTRIAVGVFRSNRAFTVLHRVILFGGCIGLIIMLAKFKNREALVIALVFLYFILIGSLVTLTVDGRYNLYLKLFLMLYCAGGCTILCTSLWNRIRHR
jgi:4-amino-4-deoxy-L-arabinose transferase-like glycosyltransferase